MGFFITLEKVLKSSVAVIAVDATVFLRDIFNSGYFANPG
ncbi:MAG: hypothetical protein LEGION0403_FIIPPAGN_01980 [Legionella sp.]